LQTIGRLCGDLEDDASRGGRWPVGAGDRRDLEQDGAETGIGDMTPFKPRWRLTIEVNRQRSGRSSKNYAVGLEIRCPGGDLLLGP